MAAQPSGSSPGWMPVVTCEHASNRLPPGFVAPGEMMELHQAYDAGALEVARVLADGLDATLHAGELSRLVVDLNRSEEHPDLIRRTVDGRVVPFNRNLDDAERRRRIDRYHRPYRDAVRRSVADAVGEGIGCLHLSVHSFTPVHRGVERRNVVGVLYDPSREPEREIARRLRAAMVRELDQPVWLNRPYRGTADGLTRSLRGCFPASRYVGIELEINRRLLAARRPAAVARGILAAVRRVPEPAQPMSGRSVR